MLVIVLENVHPGLRGFLALWLLEVRAGVFVGNYSKKIREDLWEQVKRNTGERNAIIAWQSANEAGFDFETVGHNRRIPFEIDGVKLVSFLPLPEKN